MEVPLAPKPIKVVEYVYSIVIFANLESGGKLGRKIKDAQVVRKRNSGQID
jgi:hypothetical protein